jgi:hypothetical protein
MLIKTVQPKDEIKNVFNQIAQAQADGNKELKDELKQKHLYYFTPSVHIKERRRYADIVRFTGLLQLDFDGIEDAVALKEYLYYTYKFLRAVWLSPSRKGIKAIAHIPVVNTVDEYKEYWYGIAAEMEDIEGFDPITQNPTQPLFQSWDTDLMYHSDPEIWTTKGKKNIPEPAPIDPEVLKNIEATQGDKLRVVEMIKTGMKNITAPGHFMLRALTYAVGGYVASGYIDRFEAESLVCALIESHDYLSKGVSGYQKTAKEMITKGMNEPIIL